MEAQDGTEESQQSRLSRPCRPLPWGGEPWAVTEGSKYEEHEAASDLYCQKTPLGPVRRRDVGWGVGKSDSRGPAKRLT